MSTSKIIRAVGILALGIAMTGPAFALNPQPEPPNIPRVSDGTSKSAKPKGSAIKLPPSPCKANECR